MSYGVHVNSNGIEVLSTYTPFNILSIVQPSIGTHTVYFTGVLGVLRPVVTTNKRSNNNLLVSSVIVSGNSITYTAESIRFGSTRYTGSEIHVYVSR